MCVQNCFECYFLDQALSNVFETVLAMVDGSAPSDAKAADVFLHVFPVLQNFPNAFKVAISSVIARRMSQSLAISHILRYEQ